MGEESGVWVPCEEVGDLRFPRPSLWRLRASAAMSRVRRYSRSKQDWKWEAKCRRPIDVCVVRTEYTEYCAFVFALLGAAAYGRGLMEGEEAGELGREIEVPLLADKSAPEQGVRCTILGNTQRVCV